MTDGVLPAGIAGVVDPVVGVGQDGEQVVVDLGQAQPSQRCGDDGLSKTGGGGGGCGGLVVSPL